MKKDKYSNFILTQYSDYKKIYKKNWHDIYFLIYIYGYDPANDTMNWQKCKQFNCYKINHKKIINENKGLLIRNIIKTYNNFDEVLIDFPELILV